MEKEILFFRLGACYVREENARNALQSFLRATKNSDIIEPIEWKVRFSEYKNWDSDDFSLQEGIRICLEQMFEEDILQDSPLLYQRTFREKIAPIFASKTNLEASAKAKAARGYFRNTLLPEISEARRVKCFFKLFLTYWDIVFDVLDLFILQEE